MEHLSELVYGGMDGIISTFSIVAGAAGGDLSRYVITILGISNVISDGFSMAVARYASAKTEIAQGLLINKDAFRSAVATFIFFVLIGILPIIPFLILPKYGTAKRVSLTLAAIIFFVIGYVGKPILPPPASSTQPKISKEEQRKNGKLANGFQTLALGLAAASLAYGIGHILRKFVAKG